ncbi:hypothetical protein ES702_01056 [subsurface metagenome]
MSERNFSQVAYMPYAPVEESFRIGNYEIWPYYKESSKRIKNKDVIQHLNRHFGRYFERKYDREKGGYDKPLEEIFVISPPNFELGISKFSEEQIEEIRTVSHVIAFCAINECSFVSSSADAFILYVQNFQVGSNGIALWNKYFTKLDMVKFMKPYYLDTSLLKFKKTDLCDALGKALQFKYKGQIKRIFRTAELFYHTATHGEMVTDEHRLLSLVMCFEVLLNFENKIEFVEKIENLLNNAEPKMETRTVKIKNKDINVTKSKTSWWAFDLYNLRSDVVHGNEINWDIQKYGNIWTRIQFGGILLRKLIKKILSQESLWQPDPIDSIIEAGTGALDETLENMVAEFIKKYGI